MTLVRHPRESTLVIAILFSALGANSVILQRAGHLVFGRIHDLQAVGFGLVALCMGIYSLWLYLSAASQWLKHAHGKLMLFLMTYILSIFLPFITAKSGIAIISIRVVSLFLLLIVSHVLHCQIKQTAREEE